MKSIRLCTLFAVFAALVFSSCTAKNIKNTGSDEADALLETSGYEPAEDAGEGVLSEALDEYDSETEIEPAIETLIQTEIQSEIEPEPEFNSEHDSNTEPESKTSRKVDIYYSKDNPYPERELLTSLPERDLYVYAYPIEEKSRIGNDGVSLWDEIKFYLEVDGKLVWMKDGYKTRPEYYLYFRNLFGGNEYLLFVDYVHGGHGGGNTLLTIIDRVKYEPIPMESSFSVYEHETGDDEVKFTLNDWEFSVPIADLKMTYFNGNWFEICSGKLIEYFYYEIQDLDYKIKEIAYDYQVCFRAEYVLRNGEIKIDKLEIVDDLKYYPTLEEEVFVEQNTSYYPIDVLGYSPY
jgi:hypothetical protein